MIFPVEYSFPGMYDSQIILEQTNKKLRCMFCVQSFVLALFTELPIFSVYSSMQMQYVEFHLAVGLFTNYLAWLLSDIKCNT